MEKKTLNILQVHNFYQIPGGEDTVAANERRMLEQHGHHVIQYTRHNSEIEKMPIAKKLLLPIISVFNPKTYRDIQRIIRDKHIDIVHVHNTLTLISPSVYYAALKCGVPVVQTVHNFRLICPGAVFYRNGHICEDCIKHGLHCAVRHGCYRNSRLQTLICVIGSSFHRMTGIYGKISYICLTPFNREKLLHLKGIKADRVFIKPNYTDAYSPFIPDAQRKDRLIYVGRLETVKGIALLMEAWKQMGSAAPKLLICGCGSLTDYCKRLIAQHNLNVEMRGFVENGEVKKLISESRALLMPTQLYEGFPLTIPEAFSTGTPVICSDLGNVGNMVCEGVTGFKFNAGSSDALIRAVRRMEESHPLYRNALTEYENNYTQPQNYKLLMEIYRRVMR